MANSLDLDPEWGAIDLIEEVETTFGIKIADAEAETCAKVGDLYDVVREKTPDWDVQQGKCGSLMVFNRIRVSLRQQRTDKVTPRAHLVEPGQSPSKVLRRISKETGLRLPSANMTWVGCIGAVILTGAVLGAIVLLLTGHLKWSGIAILLAPIGLPFLALDRGRLPRGLETIGDLVRRTTPLNAQFLADDGGRRPNRWSVLTALSAEHGVLPPDEITPETFFHKKSLKAALAA